MFPNVDPKALKGMLDKLGIKSRSIESDRVVIHCNDRDIVIDNPEVTLIEGQGMQNFQISGKVSEVAKGNVEVSEEDIKLVQEQTGVEDVALIKKTLEETGGDIAETILILKSGKG
jgi:nascent polypeptide-associated complex subunit alpha